MGTLGGTRPAEPLPPVTDVRPGPDAIERQIEFERVSMLYAIAPPTLAGGIAYAGLMGLMLWPLVPHALLAGWVAVKVLILALRLADGRLFARQAVHIADAGDFTIFFVVLERQQVVARNAAAADQCEADFPVRHSGRLPFQRFG